LTLAEARLREQDAFDAEEWIRKATDLQRRDDGSVPISRLGALGKSLHGVGLLMRGRADEALESTLAAQADMAKLYGSDDLSTCMLSLNVAISLDALGRKQEALAVVRHAEPVIRQAMGITAPTYVRARDLQSRLERALVAEPATREAKSSTTGMDFF
jgi:hypothetical protein